MQPLIVYKLYWQGKLIHFLAITDYVYTSNKMFSLLHYITFACAFISFSCIPTVQGYHPLSETNRRHIEDMYESFYCPFLTVRHDNAREFGVVTLESNVDNLSPKPLQFWGQHLSLTVNYFAAIPDYNLEPDRTVEDQLKATIVDWFDIYSINSNSSVADVYMLTYYNPCSYCATIVTNLARSYPHINFHIGFMMKRDDLVETLSHFQSNDNIFIGDVMRFCQDDPDARDYDCPPNFRSGLKCEPEGKLTLFINFIISLLSFVNGIL